MREDEAEVSASCRDTRWKERALTRQGLLEGSCERALAANLYTNGQLPQPGLVGRAGYLESDQHSHFLALCHLNKLLHLFEPPTHSSTIIPTSTGGCEG